MDSSSSFQSPDRKKQKKNNQIDCSSYPCSSVSSSSLNVSQERIYERFLPWLKSYINSGNFGYSVKKSLEERYHCAQIKYNDSVSERRCLEVCEITKSHIEGQTNNGNLVVSITGNPLSSQYSQYLASRDMRHLLLVSENHLKRKVQDNPIIYQDNQDITKYIAGFLIDDLRNFPNKDDLKRDGVEVPKTFTIRVKKMDPPVKKTGWYMDSSFVIGTKDNMEKELIALNEESKNILNYADQVRDAIMSDERHPWFELFQDGDEFERGVKIINWEDWILETFKIDGVTFYVAYAHSYVDMHPKFELDPQTNNILISNSTWYLLKWLKEDHENFMANPDSVDYSIYHFFEHDLGDGYYDNYELDAA